jgi:hypothetical protein
VRFVGGAPCSGMGNWLRAATGNRLKNATATSNFFMILPFFWKAAFASRRSR